MLSMEPPEDICRSKTICDDTFEVSINCTPTRCFVDLHLDSGREGLSQTYSDCKKTWLLFPPTQENLINFARTAGYQDRLLRCGDKLQGGIVLETSSKDVLDIPAGTLHAVFTTAGGFLGGINYSTSEGLGVMSRIIAAQLPFYNSAPIQINEDLE
ncbi:MAG: hypothetical protein M1829_001666, partial [Trizodia sp. TS-e1964]